VTRSFIRKRRNLTFSARLSPSVRRQTVCRSHTRASNWAPFFLAARRRNIRYPCLPSLGLPNRDGRDRITRDSFRASPNRGKMCAQASRKGRGHKYDHRGGCGVSWDSSGYGHGRLAGIVLFVRSSCLPCHAEREFAMKTRMSAVPIVAAALAASFFATPCAAMPAAALSAISAETPIQKVNGVRHHHRRFHGWHPLLEVSPGLYYGCRTGWYCFGPPLRPNFRRAWYGGFNSIYGYQGARWRPQRREPQS
jgi:hypothetical protein